MAARYFTHDTGAHAPATEIHVNGLTNLQEIMILVLRITVDNLSVFLVVSLLREHCPCPFAGRETSIPCIKTSAVAGSISGESIQNRHLRSLFTKCRHSFKLSSSLSSLVSLNLVLRLIFPQLLLSYAKSANTNV